MIVIGSGTRPASRVRHGGVSAAASGFPAIQHLIKQRTGCNAKTGEAIDLDCLLPW